MAGWGEWPQQEDHGADNFDLNLVLADDQEPPEVLGNEIIPHQNPNNDVGGEEQPVGIVVHSYENNSSEQTDNSVTQAQMEGFEPDLWDPVVLALPAASINFMHLEILEEELMNDIEIAQATQNLHVGFVQLPENLEMGPGWAAHSFIENKRPHLDSIHIWIGILPQ
jgi:hypothetical protein